MNELQVFNNAKFGDVRTLMIDNEPWFIGEDVATSLDYINPRDAIDKLVDEEDKKVVECDTPSGVQQMIVVNESGLYSLILLSVNPRAKGFKRWMAGEVIPDIRKAYSKSVSVLKVIQDFVNQIEEQEHRLKAIELQQDEQAKQLKYIGSNLSLLLGIVIQP